MNKAGRYAFNVKGILVKSMLYVTAKPCKIIYSESAANLITHN